MDSNLPQECEDLATRVDQQPLGVREAFHFCLTVNVVGAGKAKLLNIAQSHL